MPSTNIKTLLYSDNSDELVNKINNNFDEIVELHGGTEGILGPTGSQGAIGIKGSQGPTGFDGVRGTRWFIATTDPAGNAQIDDYWINSDTSQIYQLSFSGWQYTGYNVNTGDSLFTDQLVQLIPNISYAGGTGIAVTLNQILPNNYLLTVTDVAPEFGITNETLSKFLIGTNSELNDAPVLEFSKSNVENGQISDYSKHPVIVWDSTNPNDNSSTMVIPGGGLSMGLTGGFNASFDILNVNSQGQIILDYGTNSLGGIYATGGFNLNAEAGEFNIISQFIRITGGSGEFRNPITSIVSLGEADPLVYIVAGGTAPFLSTRSGDLHSNLSHTVNHIVLESSTSTEFSLNTKGKLKTNKTLEGITYPIGSPGVTGTVGSDLINWYFVSKPGATAGLPLENGNTVVINPTVTSGKIGVGFYVNSSDFFGWGGTSGVRSGESIELKVYLSTESFSQPYGGITYLGIGGATTGSAVNKVSLPFKASSIDFTLAKGVTGSAVTTVYYKAYGMTGGSGGSFTF